MVKAKKNPRYLEELASEDQIRRRRLADVGVIIAGWVTALE